MNENMMLVTAADIDNLYVSGDTEMDHYLRDQDEVYIDEEHEDIMREFFGYGEE